MKTVAVVQGKSEECEITQAGPTDVDKYEYTTGAQVRMENAISGEMDTLERN